MIRKFILLGLMVGMGFSSFAWGVLGHRIVGEIADTYLTSKTKRKIAAILGNESIAMSSNWPDFIKSDPAYGYLNPWHYINVNGGLDKNSFLEKVESDTSVNAYTKINYLRDQLKNQVLDLPTKAMYLKLLIHIIGDIHQPLHVGRLDDRGGNSIKLTWFGDNANLHQVWDERLINFQQLSYTEYVKAINFSTAAERKMWQSLPLKETLYQSYLIAEKIYADIKPDDKLGYNYNFKYIGDVNNQLLKGGVYLAGMLNDIFR